MMQLPTCQTLQTKDCPPRIQADHLSWRTEHPKHPVGVPLEFGAFQSEIGIAELDRWDFGKYLGQRYLGQTTISYILMN